MLSSLRNLRSKWVTYTAVYISLIFITGVFMRHFKFMGASPEFLLVFLVAFSLISGPNWGIIFGFFSGLFMDFTSIYLVGSQGFIYATVGYIMGLLSKKIYTGSITNQLTVVLIVSVSVKLLTYFIGEIFGAPYRPDYKWVVLTIFYNVAIAYPIFIWLERIEKN